MSDFDPDITPLHGTAIPTADPEPARDRPHPHAPEPEAVDPRWWDRLFREMDLESLLCAARACHRARRHWEQPGWPDIRQRLQIARAELWDAMDEHPENQLFKEMYRQVMFAMNGRNSMKIQP